VHLIHPYFSVRANSISHQAYELSVLTGTQVLLLVVSETGLVYTFTTPKLQPLVTKPEGKNLIQVFRHYGCLDLVANPVKACLNAPEPTTGNENGIDGESAVESPEDHAQAQVPRPGIPQQPGMAPNYMTPEQAMQYQTYLQQQQQPAAPGYPLPPGPRMPTHPQHQ
jgi:pheromone receptor transcription factor